MPLAIVCSLLLLAAGSVRADDEEGPREPAVLAPAPQVWHFRKGEARRTVDVTSLPEVVREAVLARMAADGYRRVEGTARGRDLEADARELVARGGRFPARTGASSPGAGGDPAPGIQHVLLGAPVRLESLGSGAWLRVLGAPDGSLARALGLVRGDRILSLDGLAPTLDRLARLKTVELAPGQLALRVLRREGRTESWSLTFSRVAPSARP